MSSASSGNDVLAGYLAGRVTAEQLVGRVAAEYYRDGRSGQRDALRPVIEVIERAHPGVVELSGSDSSPGFAVRLSARPFPKRYEAELRQAVEQSLQALPVARPTFPDEAPRKPGWLGRLVAAIRRVFR
jgi:hypothetical protein